MYTIRIMATLDPCQEICIQEDDIECYLLDGLAASLVLVVESPAPDAPALTS
jgi:hypothetical protein